MFASNPHYSVKLKSMFELALSHHHQYQQSGMQYQQQFQTGEATAGGYVGEKSVGGMEQSVQCPRSPQTEGEEEEAVKHVTVARSKLNSKPSFSIESLLGRKGEEGKGGRYTPYSVPQPSRSSGGGGGGGGAAGSKGGSGGQTEDKGQGKSGENKSSAGGGNRRQAKSKRVRTIFTPEQLERLEAEFERQQYMVGPERLYLASSLYLTEAQVKVWFQNRRIKWRKQHLEMEQQRLAIYRTLAEQDMLTGSTSPRPPGHGGDDESSTASSPATEVDTSGDDSREDFDSSQNPASVSPSSKVPQSTSPTPRNRVPLQQSFNLNNEEYMDSAPQQQFLFPRPSTSK